MVIAAGREGRAAAGRNGPTGIGCAAPGSTGAAGAAGARTAAGSAAADVLGAGRPAEAFANADLATRRAVIDELVDVYVKRWPRGKKGFDESSVEIVRK